ncbi:MAG: NAD-dependent protein deacylase [Candidatus Bathyarchaeota archaeon]|nr:NAD-dependent protein deacylase [Candidatus Bathyarchaeota archaeon]
MALSEEILQSIRDAAAIIAEAKYVTCLTGAGISVESGIRPFRGPGGLWTEKGEPPMDGYQRFLRDPKAYWERRLQRSSEFGITLLGSEPNPGHIALAELESIGVLKTLITQNIDNLHRAAGSVNLLEIHGNSHLMRCIECNARWPTEEFKVEVIPPRCTRCDGVVKTDTVMFGEPIPAPVLESCFQEAAKSDCMIVAGTSATVTPAASLPVLTKRNSGKLVEVNIRSSEISYICDVNIYAPSGESLPILVNEIRKLV